MSDKEKAIQELINVSKNRLKHYRNESLNLKDPVLSFQGIKLFVPEEKKQEKKEEGCFAFLRYK